MQLSDAARRGVPRSAESATALLAVASSRVCGLVESSSPGLIRWPTQIFWDLMFFEKFHISFG